MLAKTLTSLKILCPSDQFHSSAARDESPYEISCLNMLCVIFEFQRASTWSKPKCHLTKHMWHMHRKQQGPFQSAQKHGAAWCHTSISMVCISKVCDEILYNYIIISSWHGFSIGCWFTSLEDWGGGHSQIHDNPLGKQQLQVLGMKQLQNHSKNLGSFSKIINPAKILDWENFCTGCVDTMGFVGSNNKTCIIRNKGLFSFIIPTSIAFPKVESESIQLCSTLFFCFFLAVFSRHQKPHLTNGGIYVFFWFRVDTACLPPSQVSFCFVGKRRDRDPKCIKR